MTKRTERKEDKYLICNLFKVPPKTRRRLFKDVILIGCNLITGSKHLPYSVCKEIAKFVDFFIEKKVYRLQKLVKIVFFVLIKLLGCPRRREEDCSRMSF